MTDPIRVAAQALADIVMRQCGGYTSGPGFEAAEKARALTAALSAPQPAADERVAEHMRTVAEYKRIALLHQSEHGQMIQEYQRQKVDAWAAVESSARALLAAGREDAAQALAFRMLVRHWNEFGPEHGFGELMDRLENSAMQKGTP